ncbi:MAG: metallophosphoesterase [Bryobacteraceae bacterium]
MAKKKNPIRPVIVTYRSLAQAGRMIEEVAAGGQEESLVPVKPGERTRMLAQVSHAMQTLQEAESKGGVMISVQDKAASLLQSHLAREAAKAGQLDPAEAGGLEAKFDERDLAGWIGSFFTWWQRIRPHKLIAGDETPGTIPNTARLALFADWATGMYGAPVIQQSIQNDARGFQLVMHLGDTYYSGDDDEIAERLLDFFPRPAGALTRTLNGNHEMYTGGKAYFRKALPALGQSASYFALQNDHWLLLGLDTAHSDHDLAPAQSDWVHRMVANAGDRRVILFSHHQPISLLERQGPRLQEKLGDLLDSQRIFAWYWGHEHRLFLHDKHPLWGMHGRCIGHGGFPYFRDNVVAATATPQFFRLESRNLVPGGEILTGPNPYVEGHESEYGPHGYVALELDGAGAHEVCHDADGTVLREQELV